MIIKDEAKMAEKLTEIAERVVGLRFDIEELYKIIKHTIRKCDLNGKDETYLPILFENELRDYQMRSQINAIGRMNYELHNARAAVGTT